MRISGTEPSSVILSQTMKFAKIWKVMTSDKEASLLDLNIKVISNNIPTSVYDKRDDFWFPIVNFRS